MCMASMLEGETCSRSRASEAASEVGVRIRRFCPGLVVEHRGSLFAGFLSRRCATAGCRRRYAVFLLPRLRCRVRYDRGFDGRSHADPMGQGATLLSVLYRSGGRAFRPDLLVTRAVHERQAGLGGG